MRMAKSTSWPPTGAAALHFFEGTGNGESGSHRVVPNNNDNGPDSFTHTISDGHGGSATATVNVTVVHAWPRADRDTRSACAHRLRFVNFSQPTERLTNEGLNYIV